MMNPFDEHYSDVGMPVVTSGGINGPLQSDIRS